ncbi:DUF1282 domain-containing protein [Candidatus Nomurabacteria bacterium]|nr:DUF1282 domain-containing protein [Candidatus Nomurabacteria bacterium]
MDSLRYSLYVIFHPFDGFWCAKREEKGDMKAATIILAVVVVTYILLRQLTGFIFNYNEPKDLNILSETLSIIIPFLLWCAANWGITTLMDGEGTLKDIYIASAYSLVPLIIINIPLLLLSNIIVLEEGNLYYVISSFAVIWTGFLLFTGTMTIHQYTIGKTVLTIIIAIIGMAGIIFLLLLFFALIQQLINFVYIFYKEFTLRLL